MASIENPHKKRIYKSLSLTIDLLQKALIIQQLKMFSAKFVLVAFCLAAAFALSAAQLTFTSSWGKRGNALFEQQQQQDPQLCKTPTELLIEIFRFVQNQGQRFIECGPKGK